MERAIFISEFVISLVREFKQHKHQGSFQAEFSMKFGLESNTEVLVMGADAGGD
jgi:sugar (pentulose or hexulose) kinase